MSLPIKIKDLNSVDTFLEAARRHGTEGDDPDHEVGDLQDILRSCWERMTPEQRALVVQDHAEFLLMWAPLENE